jgi:hypothetical protein
MVVNNSIVYKYILHLKTTKTKLIQQEDAVHMFCRGFFFSKKKLKEV